MAELQPFEAPEALAQDTQGIWQRYWYEHAARRVGAPAELDAAFLFGCGVAWALDKRDPQTLVRRVSASRQSAAVKEAVNYFVKTSAKYKDLFWSALHG